MSKPSETPGNIVPERMEITIYSSIDIDQGINVVNEGESVELGQGCLTLRLKTVQTSIHISLNSHDLGYLKNLAQDLREAGGVKVTGEFAIYRGHVRDQLECNHFIEAKILETWVPVSSRPTEEVEVTLEIASMTHDMVGASWLTVGLELPPDFASDRLPTRIDLNSIQSGAFLGAFLNYRSE